MRGLTKAGRAAALGCWRKKRFAKKRDATVRAEQLNFGWYRCEFCRGYHLTKQRKNYAPDYDEFGEVKSERE